MDELEKVKKEIRKIMEDHEKAGTLPDLDGRSRRKNNGVIEIQFNPNDWEDKETWITEKEYRDFLKSDE